MVKVLPTQSKIILQWIQAHVGITGNDTADRWQKLLKTIIKSMRYQTLLVQNKS